MITGPYLVLAVLLAYFALLVLVAEWATRRVKTGAGGRMGHATR